MKKNKTEATIIISAVHEWIVTYLPLQRSSSIHTQKAYTDALALYVNFLESEKGISCETMSSDCFSIAFIHEWMFWLKTKRKSCNSTCNHRLACLRSFLKYLSHKDIRFINVEYDSKAVKRMKEPQRSILEITKKAMKAFFGVIDLKTRTGRQYFALFTLLYTTVP